MARLGLLLPCSQLKTEPSLASGGRFINAQVAQGVCVTLFVQGVDPDLTVHQRCGVPVCVRDTHLDAITLSESGGGEDFGLAWTGEPYSTNAAFVRPTD